MEGEYLLSEKCAKQRIVIQFALKSRKNWQKLRYVVSKSNEANHTSGEGDPVRVIFEGEFFGPPEPDSHLSEPIRKAYHPGWDSNAMTKLIVYSIQSVKPVSADWSTILGK
jgi:hypothetical protein